MRNKNKSNHIEFWQSSVISGEQLLVAVLVDEDKLVDESSESTTDKRTSPVDPVVGPRPAHDGWSKSHGWVHGGSAESSTGEDVSSNDETYGDWCDCSETTVLGINGCGVDGVDEPEGHHDLEDETV